MSEMLARVIVAISSEMGQHPKNAVCERAARAVLAAMREPTKTIEKVSTMSIAYGSDEIWRAMIDAELADIPDPEPVE